MYPAVGCCGTATLASGIPANAAAFCRFVFAVMSFTPSYTAVTGWHNERYLVKKELQQRQYGVTAMYISRTIVTTPFQCMQCLVFVSIL